MRAIVIGLLAFGCSNGGSDTIPPDDFGRENGEPCVRLGAGNSCRGGVCLPFDGTGAQGVCSEPCEDECRFGGECVRYEHFELDLDRFCFAPCVGLDSCGDDLACFGLDDLYECEGDTCASEPSERTWCQPKF